MLESLTTFLEGIGGILWGAPLVILLLGGGLILTVVVRAIQVRKVGHAIEIVRGRYDDPDDEGDINHFQALSAALSATIGIGNIVGVATAIHYGGPGALFWMWMSAFVGMATKYCECMLANHYRIIQPDGSAAGGPMYYIERGLGRRWKPLAVTFAVLTVVASIGSANMTQSNSVADVMEASLRIPRWVTGLVLATFMALVIVGGIKRIAHVASRMVPAMSLMYVAAAFFVLLLAADRIVPSFGLILRHAFTPTAAGGGFLGASVALTLQWGIKRALFSNEAGQGSAPIAHAAAKTKEPVREGLVAMLGPLVDTIIICTTTGLVIIVTGAWQQGLDAEGALLNGGPLTSWAFQRGLRPLGDWGAHVVTFAIPFYGFSTSVSWSYYGDRCVDYLWGAEARRVYRWLFVLFHFLGAVWSLRLVWAIADICNGMMAVPNIIAVVGLSGVIVRLTKDYFSRPQIPTR